MKVSRCKYDPLEKISSAYETSGRIVHRRYGAAESMEADHCTHGSLRRKNSKFINNISVRSSSSEMRHSKKCPDGSQKVKKIHYQQTHWRKFKR